MYWGTGREPGTLWHIFEFLIAKFLDLAGLVTNQLGLRDRQTGLLGNGHGIGALGLELLLQGGVPADSLEELGEVFLGHGSLGWM